MNETSRAWHTAATSPCRWPQCIRVALGHQGRPRTPGTGQGKGSSEFSRSPGQGRKLDEVATWGWGVGEPGAPSPTPLSFPGHHHRPDQQHHAVLSCQESWAFLTDGFPWKLKQAKELERIVSDPRVCENVVKCGATLPPHLGWRSEGIRLGRADGGGGRGGCGLEF